jgi:hypothetical protein
MMEVPWPLLSLHLLFVVKLQTFFQFTFFIFATIDNLSNYFSVRFCHVFQTHVLFTGEEVYIFMPNFQ